MLETALVAASLSLVAVILGLYALSVWRLKVQTELEAAEAARLRARKQFVAAKEGGTTGGETGGGGLDVDLPPWLVGLVEGVGLDPEKLSAGDSTEWDRAMAIAEKVVPKKWKQKGEAGEELTTDGAMVLG